MRAFELGVRADRPHIPLKQKHSVFTLSERAAAGPEQLLSTGMASSTSQNLNFTGDCQLISIKPQVCGTNGLPVLDAVVV